jgi:hypothetical protein
MFAPVPAVLSASIIFSREDFCKFINSGVCRPCALVDLGDFDFYIMPRGLFSLESLVHLV